MLIGLANVGEHLFQPTDFGRVRREQLLRYVGVEHDRHQRLIELVRKRRRQRPCFRRSAEMHHLQQPAARFQLRVPTAATLK